MTGAGKTIAFQGEAGAYSHLAAQLEYADIEPQACQTFDAAFAEVEQERADLAIIPIENSVASRVADIYYLLPNTTLHIIAETFLRVSHCLLAPPGATLAGLKRVRSHPQGLAQCKRIISELGLLPVPTLDTAGAAREVAEAGDPAEAAIASSLAGSLNQLETLRTNIEDAEHNITRFIILAREAQTPEPGTKGVVTSFMFRVRSVPAALYKALGGFATRGVNLTKLESYTVGQRFAVARFYAEIEGHRNDAEVRGAFEELGLFSTEVKILGVFPGHQYRQEGGRPLSDLNSDIQGP